MTGGTPMWERIGLSLSRLDHRPTRQETIAAAYRQLLRAIDAEDAVAACQSTASFCMKLHFVVDHLLREEDTWDSKSRRLDSFSTTRIDRLPPDRVRVSDAMGWGLRSNISGRFWPEPFEADLSFSADLTNLDRYRIRFGDRRSFPGEGVQEGFARVVRDIDAGAIEWAYTWHG